jgi:integrase
LVSLQTARRELELLSAAVGYWHKEHHLRYPTPVVLPDKAATNRDALTRGEAAKLLIAARGNRFQDGHWVPLQESSRANRVHLVRFILLGLYTGSRSDVSMRLRWTTSLTDPWVELDRMTLHRQGKRESVASNKRRPPVRLSNRLRRHLARWQREDQGMECDLVLHHGGRQIASVRTGFAGCVADAGLSPDITPHWLRHTAATWLMDANVPLWEAASYVGMTTATLEKHYGHHRPDHQAAARKAMR